MRICISLCRAGFHFNLGPIIRVWFTFCKVSHVRIHTNKYVIYVCSFHLWYLNLHLFQMCLEGDKRTCSAPASNGWVSCIATSSLIKSWDPFPPSPEPTRTRIARQGGASPSCGLPLLPPRPFGGCRRALAPAQLPGGGSGPCWELFRFVVFHAWRASAVVPSQCKGKD